MAAWWERLEGRAKADGKPVNPQRVVWEMSPLLPANAIVTSDSGSCANWYARDYRVQQGQSASLSGGLASMGAAVPYAIGAKFAHPDRPVDRAGRRRRDADEQHGRAHHRSRNIGSAGPIHAGSSLACSTIEDLNEVTWEQRVMERQSAFRRAPGHSRCSLFAKFAELLGFKGIFVDNSLPILPGAWEAALSSRPPGRAGGQDRSRCRAVPPHLTLKEARGFMSAMAKGERRRRRNHRRNSQAGRRWHLWQEAMRSNCQLRRRLRPP